MDESVQLGVGLRPQHFSYFSRVHHNELGWLEVISENYVDHRGYSYELLQDLSKQYEISCHGVSLNIGNPDGLDKKYLHQLRRLYEELNPSLISDHLCLTGRGFNSHELLAIPYTNKMLTMISDRVQEVQDFLQRPLGLENLSSFYAYKSDEMDEAEFLNLLVEKTGCKILLDINNVYVKSANLGKRAEDFLNTINMKAVQQVHLAGFVDTGEYLADTHSRPIYPQVWRLVENYYDQLPDVPVFIEWDSEIPPFETLYAEALKVKQICQRSL